MEFIKWLLYIINCLTILATLDIIRGYLKYQRQQKPKKALDIESRSRTTQDILKILKIYKNHPGHKCLTRHEQRLREGQLEKYLRQSWSQISQERRRPHSKVSKGITAEPAREDPAFKKISRMNRQLSQPLPQKSRLSHLLHLLFLELSIHTALPFLTFCIFCHSLRMSLTEVYLLQVEEESEHVQLSELDPV